MKKYIFPLLAFYLLYGCSEDSSQNIIEIEMVPLEVGTKTPDYEVISSTELKLASDVKLEMIETDEGENKGFVLLKANGALGGYMACGCVGAQMGNCVTENDNPAHPSCSGSCADSEGNIEPCQISGPIIGPPQNPFQIKFSKVSPVFKQVN